MTTTWARRKRSQIDWVRSSTSLAFGGGHRSSRAERVCREQQRLDRRGRRRRGRRAADCEVRRAADAYGTAGARRPGVVARRAAALRVGVARPHPVDAAVVVRAGGVVPQVPPRVAAAAAVGVPTASMLPRELGLVEHGGICEARAAVVEALLVGGGARAVGVRAQTISTDAPVVWQHPRLVARADTILYVCSVARGGRGGVGVEDHVAANQHNHAVAAGGHNGGVHRTTEGEPVGGGPRDATGLIEGGVARAGVRTHDRVAVGVEGERGPGRTAEQKQQS